MNKFLELIKNKTFVKLVAIVVAVIICISSAATIMLGSYNEWKVYYDAIMHQKYLDSLPLEFLGISAAKSEIVNYYTDGNAEPIKDDFIVTAHFTEKGKNFDEVLSSDAFTMTVPEDFATNGGDITFSYTYTPETDGEEEEPTPIVETTSLNVQLTRVALARLEINKKPYRVYYSDEMEFDPDGMAITAYYNNGAKAEVDVDDITVETKGALVAGTEKVVISYELGGVTVEKDVPVTVVAKTDYDDGDIVKLSPEGENYVIHGESLSVAEPVVRATYLNGNRLLLNKSEYSTSGNVETADFLKNCILTISLNANPIIYCRTAVEVRYGVEAENANPTAGTTVQVDESAFNGTSYVNVGKATVVNGISNGTKMTFNFQSGQVGKGDLNLRIANEGETAISLMDIATVKVNGKTMAVPTSTVIGARPQIETGYVFEDCALAGLLLKNGTNTVEITFNNMAGKGIAVDRLTFSTKYDGNFYGSMDDFFVDIIENEAPANFEVKMIEEGFHSPYGHGFCTDGTYIYCIHTTYAGNERPAQVMKYDPTTGRKVAASAWLAQANGPTEAGAGIAYVDGKVVIFGANGTKWAMDASLNGEWTQYHGFDNFEGIAENTVLSDVYFNSAQQKYAVSVNGEVKIFNTNRKLIDSFTFHSESEGYLRRVSGSNDYIYALFTQNGKYRPIVHLYDWSGNFVGRVVVPNSGAVLGMSEALVATNTNVQGILAFNDDLYFSIASWGQTAGEGCRIIKASFPKISDKLQVSLTVGEYIQTCVDDTSIDGSISVAPVQGEVGRIDGGQGSYAMGGASDGEYLYLALNGGDNVDVVVHKVRAEDYSVVATSSRFVVSSNVYIGDNARLFIKDGYLYCVVVGEGVWGIALDAFNEDGARFTKVDTQKAFGLSNIYGAKDISWNEKAGRFAIMTRTQLIIVAEDGTVLNSGINLPIPAGYDRVSSVATDDKYIYVNYSVNGQSNYPVDLYTWNGEKVTTFTFENFALGDAGKNYNVQAMFFHNGSLHFSIASWTGNYMRYHLWKASCDTTVLP